MKVTLTTFEQAVVKRKVQLIEEAGCIAPRVDQSKPNDRLNGFGAEFAFCRIWHCYPDLEIKDKPADISHIDTTVRGWKCDIKNITEDHHRLICKASYAERAEVEIYTLMLGVFPTYEYIGFALQEELVRECNLKSISDGKPAPYCLEQDQLRFFIPQK